MITRCTYCGRYYNYDEMKEVDPGYCGDEKCKEKKEGEKSFYVGDIRIPTPMPKEVTGDQDKEEKD